MTMESINSKNKYPWIDTTKSIAIFLVVWGHFQNFGTFMSLQKLIYSFHVPLFFILSGFLYKKKDDDSLGSFIRKKFRRIVLPALLWLLISVPLFIWFHREGTPLEMLRTYSEQIIKGAIPINEPCWFFLCLFIVFLLARLIRIHENSKVTNVCLALFAFSAGYLLSLFEIPDYFMMVKALVCLGFFIVGHIAGNTKFFAERSRNRSLQLLSILAAFVLWILSALIFNEKVTLYGTDFGNYWMFILSGLTGTFFLCETVRFFSDMDTSKEKRLCERYPVNYSPFIICSHYLVFIPFALAMRSADLLSTRVYDIVFPVFIIALFIAYYPLSKLVSKYTPYLNGEPGKGKHSRKA